MFNHHDYLFPAVFAALPPPPNSIFEVGTGDGYFLKECALRGYEIQGLELHPENIGRSREHGICHARSILDDVSDLGRFDVVVSMEVIEHIYEPRKMVTNLKALMKPNGIAIITTPYHGYLKNVAIALFNRWDSHHSPLCDGGHIKFWSRPTLTELFKEQGLEVIGFARVGRIGFLARSMVFTIRAQQ